MTTLWILHITLVGLSLSLFIWRGSYMWRGQHMPSQLWQRHIPDSIDTLLFISGISLAYTLGFSPWHDDWLLAKLVALVIYICLGFIALSPRISLPLKRGVFMLALLTATYIIAVAHSKWVIP